MSNDVRRPPDRGDKVVYDGTVHTVIRRTPFATRASQYSYHLEDRAGREVAVNGEEIRHATDDEVALDGMLGATEQAWMPRIVLRDRICGADVAVVECVSLTADGLPEPGPWQAMVGDFDLQPARIEHGTTAVMGLPVSTGGTMIGMSDVSAEAALADARLFRTLGTRS